MTARDDGLPFKQHSFDTDRVKAYSGPSTISQGVLTAKVPDVLKLAKNKFITISSNPLSVYITNQTSIELLLEHYLESREINIKGYGGKSESGINYALKDMPAVGWDTWITSNYFTFWNRSRLAVKYIPEGLTSSAVNHRLSQIFNLMKVAQGIYIYNI